MCVLVKMSSDLKRPPLEKQKSKDLHVNFVSPKTDDDESKKHLTAKYGSKEISLIRKRLEVENWMFDKLNEFSKNCKEENNQIEIDLDKVLEIEKDEDKKNYLLDKLESYRKVQKTEIDEFIECLLEKSKSVVTNL